MTADISIVVCAHDERRWNELCAALRSLERQSVSPREVLVVVDHNPLLLERARDELRNVVVVDNRDERGLGGARNAGVKASSGAIVAFLDDDAVACRDWVALLRDGYTDPHVAGVGGSSEPVWAEGRPVWFPEEFDWVVGCSFRGTPETRQEVRNLFGCNMSYRRELVLSLGLFRLGYGCDETEFCIRLRQTLPEMRLLYVPEAKVRHHVPAARARFRRYLSRCFFEGGSKAVVSRLVGAREGLATEASYTARVLPAAVARVLTEAATGRDFAGILRAGAVIAGLVATTAGYAVGQLSPMRAARARGWQGKSLRGRAELLQDVAGDATS
jgi:GT2 family glycosyltransferase